MSSEEKNRKDLFGDMPLPEMEASWQQMKEKLKEDKDDKKPGIFLYFRSCAIWGLLLLLIAGAGWYFIWGAEKETETTAGNELAVQQNTASGNIKLTQKNKGVEQTGSNSNNKNSSIEPGNNQTGASTNTNSSGTKTGIAGPGNGNTQKTGTTKKVMPAGNDAAAISDASFSKKDRVKENDITAGTVNKGNKNKKNKQVKAEKNINIIPGSIADNQEQDMIEKPDTVAGTKLSLNAEPAIPAQKNIDDTSLVAINNNKAIADSAKAAVSKSKKAKKGFVFSAGLGLQKQVPIGGQTAVAHNYAGGKNTVADQLPSVYARLEKNKKWFADVEFQYGSAQMLQAFSYSRKTSLQDSGRVLSVSSLTLKKTYYHRLPVSFNYYVLPRFSVGSGIEYSWLYGAVAEKTVRNKNLQTDVQSSGSELINIKHFNDSFLYKNQVRLMLQTSYQWKRFSFGLRYSRDLEPYIMFTTPAGDTRSKRSQSLQAMIKYRLWEGEGVIDF